MNGPLRTAFAIGLSLCAALAAARPAYAEPARDPAAAEILFEKGRAALGRGEVDPACAFFAESLRLDPGVGTLFNLATCEERQGKTASAWQHLREGIEQLPAGDPRQKPAEAHARDLAPRVPHLALRLPANVVDARVFRDDVELSSVSLGLSLPLNPGLHRVIVTAKGHEPSEVGIAIAEGETKAIVVAPGEVRKDPVRTPTSKRPGGNTGAVRVVGFALAGVGIAALAIGAVGGGIATGHASTVRSQCDVGSGRCSQAGLDALETTKTWGAVSTVGLIAGGALVAAGLVCVLVLPSSSSARSTTILASAAGSIPLLTF